MCVDYVPVTCVYFREIEHVGELGVCEFGRVGELGVCKSICVYV